MEKKLFYVLLFAAATGLCTGAFFEVSMEGEGKARLMELRSVFFDTEQRADSFGTMFLQNLRGGLLLLLLCFFSQAVWIFLPADLLLLFCRSLSLGFSAAMLLETFGLPGIRYILLTLAPSGLLQTILFAFFCAVSFRECFRIFRLLYSTLRSGRLSAGELRYKKNRTALQLNAWQYLCWYLAGFAVLILSCLLQTALLQSVL